MLLVLNGPPGVGKSTLAKRYVDDHPLALAVEIDQLRSHLGRWQDIDESKLVARDLAVALARAHLAAGYDVIVPQFLGRPSFVERLALLADETGAAFKEIVLTDDIDRITVRFRARRAELATTGVAHPQADLNDVAIEDALRASNARLLRDAATREVQIISADGGVEAAYESLQRALARSD